MQDKMGFHRNFAPEVVLYTALQQWYSARKLMEALDELPNSKSDNRKFDMVYCFYVVMGGFVADFSQFYNEYIHLTLTPFGIRALALKGHFIAISGRSIRDKSKADNLAKAFVCLQMAWLIVQCVGRKVYGYPVSLLEWHTLVHAIYALIMYLLWISVCPALFFNHCKRAPW
jgi:hypothetical protein